jgi:hypothetical protein
MTTKSLETLQTLLNLYKTKKDVSLWSQVRQSLVEGRETVRVSRRVWNLELGDRENREDADRAVAIISLAGAGFAMSGICALIFSDSDLSKRGVSQEEIRNIDREYEQVRGKYLD